MVITVLSFLGLIYAKNVGMCQLQKITIYANIFNRRKIMWRKETKIYEDSSNIR